MLPMLNRSALVLTPKQPFRDWLRGHMEKEKGGVNEEILAEAGLIERTVYLLPDWDYPDQAWALLRDFSALLFEEELAGWYTDESMWPEKRDFETFCSWFEPEFMSVVADTYKHPLELD